MEFKIDVQKLVERLGLIQGIAERRATMAVLSHVMISAMNGKIQLIATDLETTMKTFCDASVSKEGSLSLPSRKLYEIVNELQSDEVGFREIENHWVEIISSSARFRIAGLPGEDFPVIPEFSSDDLFTVNSSKMDDMISKTIFAVSLDDLRRNLSGIFFEKDGERILKLAATDGHRLSLVEADIENEIKLEKNIVVPKKGVSELKKIIKFGEDINIGCKKNFFMAEGEDITLIVRLIDAEFPDYKQVIPDSTKHEFQLNRQVFLSALKRVSILTSEKTKGVKININNEGMTLISIAPELGEAKELIPIKFTGETFELGFNARYMIDALEVMDEQDVVFGITDELSPAVIKPAEKSDYISVIMPMRV